jgi:hypothetical protein
MSKPSDGVFMKRASSPRTTAELSQSFHQQLNIYAIVAGAAGVGALASTDQPSSGLSNLRRM